MSTLKATLETFREQVNSNRLIAPLLKNWQRTVIIDCEDSGATYSLIVRDCRLVEIREGRLETGITLNVAAEEAVIEKIFTGALNPSTAFLDGEIEVYGDDADKVKLDAITLVLWGL